MPDRRFKSRDPLMIEIIPAVTPVAAIMIPSAMHPAPVTPIVL